MPSDALLMALFRPVLLLQTTMPAPGLPAWLPGVAAAVAGLLLTLYFNLRKETREDGMTPGQRLKKVEARLADHELRQQGFQVFMEDVADKAHAAREAQNEKHRVALETQHENHRRDVEAVKETIKDVPNMRDLLARIDENMKAYKADVGEIKGKMDRLYELLTKR